VNEVPAVLPANLLFAVTVYAVAPTEGAQASETVEAVEPVTTSEPGGLGCLESWLRYWPSGCLGALVGLTARSTALVVAATRIALRHAAVAKPCRFSLTNARTCEPDAETFRSLATCAGPLRRTATISSGVPRPDRAIAAESELTLEAHTVSAGLLAPRQVARTALTLCVAFAFAGGTSSITHSLAAFAAFTVALSFFSVSRLGSTTTAVIPARLIRPRDAGRVSAFALAPISTPQNEGCSVLAGPAATLACAAAGQTATDNTAATAQSTRNPPERPGCGLGGRDHAVSRAEALRGRRLEPAEVGAAPTMTP
jgi:hypothetical protein